MQQKKKKSGLSQLGLSISRCVMVEGGSLQAKKIIFDQHKIMGLQIKTSNILD